MIVRLDARVESCVLNTLEYYPDLCVDCGACTEVCPHAVFERADKGVRLANAAACMECGACRLNCPSGAISVQSGVGCAAAMIYAALTGKPEQC
jgi:NAD-dependent dihydropyrimidine dehydrogenase PreA subunit